MAFIENTIAEHHLIQGEALLDTESVLEVVEVEKKLWSVMIKDDGILEVEIQNPNQKNQKSTCECKEFKESNSCAHIAAALLYLRKKEEIRLEKKRNKELPKQSFNIKTILNAIDSDQLKNYVRSYAQKDKKFGIMLKASFAHAITLNDNIIKYQSILNNLIKPLTTEKLKSNTADIRLALNVVSEFNSQLEDNMSISLFDDAFIIMKATLPKLHYLYSKYPIQKDKAASWIAKFHNHLDQLYDEKLSPKFKAEIDEFILELTQKSYFSYLPNALSLFQVLEKHKRKTAKLELVESLLTLSNSDIKPENRTVYGAIMIINKKYKKIPLTIDEKIESVKYLMKTGSEKAAVLYLEYFLENESRNRQMEVALIDAYEILEMDMELKKLAVDIFVKYEDFRYYRLLKNKVSNALWPITKEAITESIVLHNPTSSFLATYYFNEEMENKLIKILESEADLRHIMKYDDYLYKSNYISLEKIYHKAISKYLDTHVGAIASNFIQEVITHLSNIRAYKMETSLKKYISTNYPHRASIITFS